MECIREAAFVVGRRSEAFCLLLLIPVNEIGSLVDAKVVQVEQRANELGTSVEGNPEGPSKNSPPLHEDTERLLHLHSQLAQVEVKGVLLGRKALARIRRHKVVAEGVGRIPQDVVAVRQLVHSLRHLTACVRRLIVARPRRCARHAQEPVSGRSYNLDVQVIATLRSGVVSKDVQHVVD